MGLAGEVRGVGRVELRAAELARVGFGRVVGGKGLARAKVERARVIGRTNEPAELVRARCYHTAMSSSSSAPPYPGVRVTYDPDADAAYLYLRPIRPGEARSRPLTDTLIADFDADGRLLGLEVLAASATLPPELLAVAEPPGRRSP